MNKIDLEILEIVKDYTNKELVRGCLIKVGKHIYEITYVSAGNVNISYQDLKGIWGNKSFDLKDVEEILGQLEITAIEKYIGQFHDRIEFNLEKRFFMDRQGNVLFKIPNKPYNTYTETQKIELRELLLKINK